jgi:hypothetical protein
MHHGEAQRCVAWRPLTEEHLSPPATKLGGCFWLAAPDAILPRTFRSASRRRCAVIAFVDGEVRRWCRCVAAPAGGSGYQGFDPTSKSRHVARAAQHVRTAFPRRLGFAHEQAAAYCERLEISLAEILAHWRQLTMASTCPPCHSPPILARLHQLDAIFTIFGASDRDKRLILQGRGLRKPL